MTSSISTSLQSLRISTRTGAFVRSTRSRVKSSNLGTSQSFPSEEVPALLWRMARFELKSHLRSFLAFFSSIFKRWRLALSVDKSYHFQILQPCVMIISGQKSSPPFMSPAAANTSKTTIPNSRIESNVPPPRSNTKIFSSLSVLSKTVSKGCCCWFVNDTFFY